MNIINSWSINFRVLKSNDGFWFGAVTYNGDACNNMDNYHCTADYANKDRAINASYNYVQHLVWKMVK